MDLYKDDPQNFIQLKINILKFFLYDNDFSKDENGKDFDADMKINETKAILSFLVARPDGVVFEMRGRICVFMEFTRPMDSPCENPPKWAEKKDTYKSGKYARQREFIEHISELRKMSWTCKQTNFSVSVRGSIRTADFDDRLKQLGVESDKDRNVIRTNAIYKTLDLTDSVLTLFFVAIHSSPQ